MHRPILVWDIFTRLFHWSLVLLVALLWLSAEEGRLFARALAALGLADTEPMRWHGRFGYGVLGLLVFRLLWGLVGSDTARFARFLRGPRAVLAYLRALARGRAPASPGHNPAGGWMVVTLIAVLLLQVGLGLMSSDGEVLDGPFAAAVGERLSGLFSEWHEEVFEVLLVFIGLHVAAVAFHSLVKREPLLPAMLHGKKPLPEGTPAPRLAGWLPALACMGAAALAVYALL